VFHEPLDRKARHFGALTIHLVPNLGESIDLHTGLPDGLNLL
jgi:hypothetical protein